MVLAIAGMHSTIVAQSVNDKKAAPQLLRRCDERTIAGNYGYKFTGTFFVSPTTSLPLTSVGRMIFDGTGNVSGTDFGSFGGSFGTYTATGTYTVEADCTGTLNVTLNPGGFTIDNKIVVVDNGKEIFLIETNPGAVVSGVIKQQ